MAIFNANDMANRFRTAVNNLDAAAGRELTYIEIANILNARKSKSPPEYQTIITDAIEIIRERLTPAQKLLVRNWIINQGLLTDADFANIQKEVKTTRWEEFGGYPGSISLEELKPIIERIRLGP